MLYSGYLAIAQFFVEPTEKNPNIADRKFRKFLRTTPVSESLFLNKVAALRGPIRSQKYNCH